MNEQNLDLLITISPEEFDRIKTDPAFVNLMILARATNAINFCISVMKSASEESKSSDAPAGSRQLLNAFLFSCGMLYEGLNITSGLGRDFHDLESFRNGFQQLWANPITHRLRQGPNGPLCEARNRVAFHFLRDDMMGATLRGINAEASDQIVFASAKRRDPSKPGVAPNDVYYTFADEVAVNYLAANPGAGQTAEEKVVADWQDITYLLNLYLTCANSLIEEVVAQKGWNVEKSW